MEISVRVLNEEADRLTHGLLIESWLRDRGFHWKAVIGGGSFSPIKDSWESRTVYVKFARVSDTLPRIETYWFHDSQKEAAMMFKLTFGGV